MKIKNIIFGKRSILTKDISKKLDNFEVYSTNDLHLIDFDKLNKQKSNYIFNNFYPSSKLNTLNIEYNTYDILKNNELRERLKTLKCKTYPQLWFKSKYICNGDIIKNKENLMELLDTFN